jgi:gliding motility-associated-like protein
MPNHFYIYKVNIYLHTRNYYTVFCKSLPFYYSNDRKAGIAVLASLTRAFFILSLFMAFSQYIFAQSFTPVGVNGFNQDVVAEAGTSSLTTTTMALDGVASSNKVCYTNTFRITNGFGGGGLPDNGTITDAFGTYQLAPYTGSNCLLLQRNQAGDLFLNTPASFSVIRVLGFSAEGPSQINVTLFFTDGTSTTVLTNYALDDWFPGVSNIVISGYGRCVRATPASGPEGWPTNPKMYYINIPLSCTDKKKSLSKINFANVTTTGANAPYPNSVFFAVSGISNNPVISASITSATCTVNGSVTLNISGITNPYTVTWNTAPVQTGPTATNLPPGTYQATITDAGGCDTIFPVTIPLVNNLFMTVHADTSICSGSSFNANTISNAASYNWSPITGVSNPNIANPVITPTATTTYTVTGTTGICTISKSFTVTFLAKAIAKFGYVVTPCSNAPVTFSDSSVVAGGTINQWHWIENGVLISTVQNPVIAFPQGTHTIGLVVAGTVGCTSDTVYKTFTITTKPLIDMDFTNACRSVPVNFTGLELNGAGVTTWTWIFDDGTTAAGISTQHSYSSAGVFPVKLVGISAAGCASDTLNRFITIYVTNANAGNDTTVAAGQPFQLNGSGGISYSWSPAQYLNNPNIPNPTAVLQLSQVFTLTAYTPAGCETYDQVKVNVINGAEIYLPGAFTPNGDGSNDVYKALPVGIREFKYLRIYNRFGQQIFSTTDYKQGWDGTIKGAKQGSGVYVAIASGIAFTGFEVNSKGTFVLVR